MAMTGLLCGLQLAERVLPFVGDTVEYVNEAYDAGQRILVEGANATMLDLDFGTYPFVTSSNPSIGGVASGLGLAPRKFDAIIGVVRICFVGWKRAATLRAQESGRLSGLVTTLREAFSLQHDCSLNDMSD